MALLGFGHMTRIRGIAFAPLLGYMKEEYERDIGHLASRALGMATYIAKTNVAKAGSCAWCFCALGFCYPSAAVSVVGCWLLVVVVGIVIVFFLLLFLNPRSELRG